MKAAEQQRLRRFKCLNEFALIHKEKINLFKSRERPELSNTICRYALLLSFAEKSVPPVEDTTSSAGIEIDWKVFCGNETALYEDLLIQRCMAEGRDLTDKSLKECLTLHLHRGLAYLNASPEKIFT